MNYNQCYAEPIWIARALCFAAAFLIAGSAPAQSVVRVEEDWHLEVGGPDVNSVGPQILTTMSPSGTLTGTYFTMELNHRSAPSWTPGGISIHRWTGEARNASYDRSDRTIMNTENEVVTWTQALYQDNGRLYYKVYNGVSSTWGPFGHSNLLRLDTSWSVGHIDGYSPAVSVAQSGAAYAGNRIKMLKINSIRVTLSDSSVLTDNTERIVQQLIE